MFRKCAASWGSTPLFRNPSAIRANLPAASSVTLWTVRVGLSEYGSSNIARKTRRFSGSGSSAFEKLWTSVTVPVKLV